MQPFTLDELMEIERITNEDFLKGSKFSVSGLSIEIVPNYFLESSNAGDTSAYLVKLSLSSDDQTLDFAPMPFTVRTSNQDIAFHIAHQIWSRFDSNVNSPIWKNFDPKG